MPDDTAQRLRDMMRSLEAAIAAQVDSSVLFDVEEALGTFPESRLGVQPHRLQQVAAIDPAVGASLRDTMNPVSSVDRLREEIVESVMREPGVVAAMANATRCGVVDAAVSTALKAVHEELIRRGLR